MTMNPIMKNRVSVYLYVWLGFFVLFYGGCLIYSTYFGGFFVFDYGNYLHALVNRNNITTVFSSLFLTPWSFRIIENLQFFLCFNLFGLNPTGYLAVGMLTFAAGIVLVYYCVFTLSKSRAISFISSFLMVIHPLNLEKFGLICPAHLEFVFFAAALLSYSLSLLKNRKVNIFYILALVFYIAAIFTRVNTLIFPLFIVAYCMLFERPLSLIKIIKSTAGFFIITGVYLWLRLFVLSLTPAQQTLYTFDFFNLSNILHNYKMFSILALKIVTNPYKIICTWDIYLHNLLSADKAVVLFFVIIILYFSILVRKKDFFGPALVKTRFKLFLLGCLWYSLGLLPFLFFADDSHTAIRHLALSTIGSSMAIAIVVIEVYRRIYAASRYLANGIIFLFLINFFYSTYLISRNVFIDRNYDYTYIIRHGFFNKSKLEAINKTYPIFPPRSKIYFINFHWASRIPEFIKIFYKDESFKTFLLTEQKLKEVSLNSGENIFVFMSLKNGQVSDLTAEYNLQTGFIPLSQFKAELEQ